MADMEEQDRRRFLLANKSDDPMKTYSEMQQAAAEAMTPKPDMDLVEKIDWLRQQ